MFNFCSSHIDSTAEDHSEEEDDTLIEKEKNACQTAFVIARIRNRFDDEWTADNDLAVGYRDLSFKLLMAFEESDCGGCWFVPVSDWAKKSRRGKGLQTMICEIQLKLKGELSNAELETLHARYVIQRNLLSQ